MAKLVKFLVIFLPVVEIAGLLLVGEEIGVASTMLLLLAGVVVGVGVIRWLGAAAFRDFQTSVRQGAPPLDALQTGAATLGAGVLFIIPGFLTDILAILLLIRAGWLRLRRRPSPAFGGMNPEQGGGPGAGLPGVAKIVDAEFVIVEKEPQPDIFPPKREAP